MNIDELMLFKSVSRKNVCKMQKSNQLFSELTKELLFNHSNMVSIF